MTTTTERSERTAGHTLERPRGETGRTGRIRMPEAVKPGSKGFYAFPGEDIRMGMKVTLPVGAVLVRKTPTGDKQRSEASWEWARVPEEGRGFKWSEPVKNTRFQRFVKEVAAAMTDGDDKPDQADAEPVAGPEPRENHPLEETSPGTANDHAGQSAKAKKEARSEANAGQTSPNQLQTGGAACSPQAQRLRSGTDLYEALNEVTKDGPDEQTMHYSHGTGLLLATGQNKNLKNTAKEVERFMDEFIHEGPKVLMDAYVLNGQQMAVYIDPEHIFHQMTGFTPADLEELIEKGKTAPEKSEEAVNTLLETLGKLKLMATQMADDAELQLANTAEVYGLKLANRPSTLLRNIIPESW